MHQLNKTIRCKREQPRASDFLHHCGVAALIFVFTLFAPQSEAGKRCWSLDEVMSAHKKQGDEILLIFSSWIRDGAYTIIYKDPSDGVVTEVAVSGSGIACISDVGDDLKNSSTVAEQPLG
jgi:hypothetical protein